MNLPSSLLPRVLVVALACSALAPLRAADALPSADDRAEAVRTAMMYWKATAAAGNLETPDARHRFYKWSKAVWERNYAQIDEKALAEEVKLYSYSLDLMRTASQRRACDWGEVDSGNASGINSLFRCLRLRAWLRLRQGDAKGAADDLLTLLDTAQHIANQALILYDFSAPMQWVADYTAAAQLTKLDEASLQRLAAGIRALAPVPAPAAILRSMASHALERDLQQVAETRAKRQTLQEADWFPNRLTALPEEPTASPDEVARVKERFQRMTLDEYAQGLPAAYQPYEEEAKLMEQLPYAQAHSAIDKYTEDISRRKESDPLPWVVSTLPNYIQDRTLRVAVNRAMLLAAIEAQLHGRQTLAQAKDPVTGEPFIVREVQGGYELESKLFGDSGKPVTMFVDSAASSTSAAAPSVADSASEDDLNLGPFYRRMLAGRGRVAALAFPGQVSGSTFPDAPAAVATALTYWQSFALLPKLTSREKTLLNQAEKTASLGSRSDQPLDEKALAPLLASFGDSVELFRQAAARPDCDWQLDFSQGPGMNLPQWMLRGIQPMQSVVQALQAGTGIKFQQGDAAGAEENLATILRASVHAGEPALPTPFWRQQAMGASAVRQAAANLAKFDDASLQKLAAEIKTLPVSRPLPDVVLGERALMVDWQRRQVDESIAKHESFKDAKWAPDDQFTGPDQTADQAEAAKKILAHWRASSMEDVRKQVDAADQQYRELAHLLERPYAQSHVAVSDFLAKIANRPEDSPFAWAFSLPKIGNRLQNLAAESQTLRAMLLAAMDAKQHGREVLAQAKNPVTDEPFTVREVKGGYELESKAFGDGKPVTLFVDSAASAASAAAPTANVAEDDFDLGPFYRRMLAANGANWASGSTATDAQTPGAEPPGDARDTALLYWQAFALAPQLTEEEKTFCWETFRSFNKATDKPVDEAALAKLLEKYEASLQIFHKAAALPACDWQIDLSQGPDTAFPHLARMQDLASALRLRARLRLRLHQPAAAEEDIKTILGAAAHLKNPAVLISSLVQTTLYGIAINGAAGGLAEFDEASMQRLVSDVQAHSPNVPLGPALLTEQEAYVGWLRRHIDGSLAKHETLAQARWFQDWVNNMLSMAGTSGGDLEKVGSALRQMSMEELKQQMDEADRLYGELAQLLGLPYAKSHATIVEYVAKFKERKGAIPLTWLQVPDVGMFQNKVAQGQAWHEMLLAAIEARRHGREALAKARDPFGDGAPFAVQEMNGGYKLASKLVVNGKAVSLFVGE